MKPDEVAQLWQIYHSHAPSGSVFRYFARNPTTKELFGTSLKTPNELKMVTKWADKNGYSSYWQPNPTSKEGGTRCKTHNITAWSWFLLDIDPVKEQANPQAALVEAERILYVMLQAPMDGYWCLSGRGIQAWYPLPIMHDTQTVPRVQSYWLGQLSHTLGTFAGCVLDPSSGDLPRVMRVPGTLNPKTGVRAEIIRTPTTVNTLLQQRLLERTPAHVLEPKKLPERLDNQPWQCYVTRMTTGGRRFLLEGCEEGARHKGATAAMLSLVELGASADECMSALLYGAQFCTPPLHSSEITDMVTRKYGGIHAPR